MDRQRILWWAFTAVGLAHLVGQATGTSPLHLATKPLLMPLLAAWFVTATPPGRLRTLVAIGLGFSWLGDLGLMPAGEGWFLVGLGAFLLAQLTYSVAFWPYRNRSVLARPPLALPYLAALGVLLVALWPGLDDLVVPVVAYAVVIIVMAMLATGLGAVVAVGALLFVASDSLIAFDAVAGLARLPGHGFWVMLTYLAAQTLIARGVRERARAAAATRRRLNGPRRPAG